MSLLNKEYVEIINVMFNKLNIDKELTIIPETSPKGYTAYHFKYDFGTEKYESFIIIYEEDNTSGADENNWDEIKSDIDKIFIKADKIRGEK